MKNEYSNKLKKWLPRGYAGIIADQEDVSRTTVYNVLTGRYKNEKIMDVLISLAEDNKKKIQQQADKIFNL